MTDHLPHKTIWALSDGRAGMTNQVVGLCERLERAYGLRWVNKIVAPTRRAKIWPTAWAANPAKHIQDPDILAGPHPDMIVGCGRMMIPLLLHFRKQGITTVYLQDPRIAPDRFDLVIAPDHDPVTGPNVIKSLGSIHRASIDRITTMPPSGQFDLLEALPQPRIGVLIGGDNKYLSLSEERAAEMVEQLTKIAEVNQASLMITASRRTSDAAMRLLRLGLAGAPHCFFWDGTGDNPYFDFLKLADAFIVTEDSVNMASEAAATGKPVYILPLLRKRRFKGLLAPATSIKFDKFHAALKASGAGHELPADGRLSAPPHPPLDPATDALPAIKTLLAKS